jgi:hypothetical protein
MPSHSSALGALVKHDLEACTDVPSIFMLFRKLRYPIEEVPLDVPLDPDDLPSSLRDSIVARYPVAQIGGTYPGEALISVTLFELKNHTHKNGLIRSISQAWTRRFIGEHLLIFAVNDALDQKTIVHIAFVNTRRLVTAYVALPLHERLVGNAGPRGSLLSQEQFTISEP